MEKLLFSLFERLAKQHIERHHAARIRQGVVLPVLGILQWQPLADTFSVYPEFKINEFAIADYALVVERQPRVLFFVADGNTAVSNLIPRVLQQVKGVPVAIVVVTNGSEWQLFVRNPDGEIQSCGHHTTTADHIEETANLLTAILAKAHVVSGKAYEYALALGEPLTTPTTPTLSEHGDFFMQCDTALKNILSKTEELWVQLITEELQKIGHQEPSKELIRSYLHTLMQELPKSR